MHSHAVIHRDIKPDNVIISGTHLSDDANWCDDYDDPQVQQYLPNWQATLIDFGFAVALKPGDINKFVQSNNETKTSNMNELRSNYTRKMSLEHKLTHGVTGTDHDISVSKIQIVDLASLGNRNYAAPEILKTIHKQKGQPTGHNVSNYGMTADAYSLGALLRYILTGVPPEYTIEEYISRKNNLVGKVADFLSSISFSYCRSKTKADGSEKKRKRWKRFKRNHCVPKDAANLVHLLTMRDVKQRMTVRNAQTHPWIKLKNEDDPSVHEELQFLTDVLEETKILST
jgi:serine/threonine protein kinase